MRSVEIGSLPVGDLGVLDDSAFAKVSVYV